MVACDHYHRFRDDVALMAELGIKHYRFSIAWPRIIPDGTGAVNQEGLGFYKALVDCLVEHGIRPHATLFHWDSPQALEDRYGSWRSRQMATDFADYVSVVVAALGDRIQDWMTINEILCFTKLGYAIGKPGVHAPGTAVHRQKEIQQTVHHALLAHGLGCQAIRAASPGPCTVSLVDNYSVPVPVSESEANIAAAGAAFRHMNGDILVPALTGQYDPAWLQTIGDEAPDITDGDLDIIAQPLDRLGLNIYSGSFVEASDGPLGYRELPLPPGYPRLHMPWLNLNPDAIYWGVRHVGEALGRTDLPIFISENGCACDDQVEADGRVIDLDRIRYLRDHMRAGHRAVVEELPLIGWFIWSFMDNFEWAWGYDRRFGITRVDYNSQQRTPKESFRWYQEVIRQNRVV
jgi:beta-glucosidase